MEEAPATPTLAPPAPTPAFLAGGSISAPAAAAATAAPTPLLLPPPPASPQAAPPPDRESRRSGSVGGRMGLTKEALSAHTQQEEQAFLDRFKDLSKLRVFDQTASSALRCHPPTVNPLARGRRQPAAQELSAHTNTHSHSHMLINMCRHSQTRMHPHAHALRKCIDLHTHTCKQTCAGAHTCYARTNIGLACTHTDMCRHTLTCAHTYTSAHTHTRSHSFILYTI